MARLDGDKIVVKGPDPKPNASFDDLKKIASEKSPVSTLDPETYAKGK